MGFDFGIGEAAIASIASSSIADAGFIGASEAAATAAASALTPAAFATGASSFGSILSTAGLVSSAVGGITSAVGAERSAAAQGASAQYAAQVAANNQTIANQNAELASASGANQVEASGLKTRATVGAIKAAQAASNIDVNTGSAVDVRSSAAELGELDALTIRSNAEKQVYGYQTQGAAFGGEQGLQTAIAAQAPVAGALGAAGSLLSGATGVATQYANWQRAAGGSVSSAIFG